MLALVLLALALTPAGGPPPAPPPERPAVPAPPRAPPPPGAERGPPEGADEPVLVGFEKKSGKHFSGDFDETDVNEALGQIAESAGWSIVFAPGDHGTISAHFKDTPVEDAFRAVLEQAGLSAAREGSLVTVRVRSAFPALHGLSRDVRRLADEARREAERARRRAEREAERAERQGDERSSDKVAHGDVLVRTGEEVRDVVAISGSVKVQAGAEVRDVVALLGSVELEPGARAREAVAIAGDVKLGPGAAVEQDAVSVGGHVFRDPSATVGDETVSVGVPVLSGLATLFGSRLLFGSATSPAFAVGQVLAKFLVYFALGLLVLALFPRRLEGVSASFATHPWKAVFTGLLGIAVTPIVIVLLIATVIGIPLVAVAGLLLVAAGVLGFTSLAFHIGRSLPLRLERGTNVLQLAMGTAIVVLITAIPFIGGMAWIAAALLTFGAVLRSRFGGQPVLPTTVPPPAPPTATPA